MSCPILKSQLQTITKDEDVANELYSYFETNEFKEIFFGNFNVVNNPEIFEGRINEENEPILHLNKTLNKYYFLDVDNEPVFYPYTRQGLQQFFSNNNIKIFSKTLALNFFNRNFKFNEESFDFDRKNTIKLENFIKEFIDSKISELSQSKSFVNKIQAKALMASKDHLNEWYDEVISFFNSLKLDVKEEEVTQLEQEEEEFRGEIVRVESFLKSSKSNVNENIKLFLSTLTEDSLNNFNEFNFINFDDIWKTLNSKLWGIIAVNNEYGLEDEFELYLDVIKELSIRKPYLKQLLFKLNNKKEDETFKNQFVNAFRLNKNNFLTSEFNKDNNGLTHTVLNVSNVSSLQNNILDQWLFNFEQLKVNPERLKTIESLLNKHFQTLSKESNRINTDANLIPHIENLINDLKKLGIELGDSQAGIDYFLDDLSVTKPINERLQNLLNLYQASLRTIDALKNQKENSFKDQTLIKKLAEAEAFFLKDGSDASIFSVGKSKWVYSLPSYLSNKLNIWKKDPTLLLKHYEATPFNKGSHWMYFLTAQDFPKETRLEESKRRLNDVELGIFNSVQEEGDSLNGVDGKTISYVDSLADYINKLLAFKKGAKVWHKTALAADKQTEYQLHMGNDNNYFNLSSNTRYVDGKFNVSEEVLDIFYKYFEAEYDRMRYEYEFIQENSNNTENLLPNYHTGSKNALKSQLFPSLSIDFDKEGNVVLPNNKFKLYNADGKPIFKSLDSFENQIRQHISNIISKNIEQIFKTLMINNIFSFDKNGSRINNGLDVNVYNTYLKEVGINNPNLAIAKIAGDLFVNSIISQVEYSKMFTGDIAFYKNMIDYKKRVPETYTDGQYMRLLSGEEFFNVAVISSVEIPLPYMDKLEELVGKEIVNKYANTNATDAQAWITPKRWEFIMRRLGKWSKTHESAYKKMNSDKNETFTDKELKVLGQPLKGVYFDIKDGNPVFLKYSQAVLWKPLIKGNNLEKIYNQMVKDKIDELVTKDGIKVGYNTPNKIHDKKGNLEKSFKFNPLSLNNNAWKLQQDLPVKGLKKTDVGSQIQKIIFQGLVYNQNEDFTLNDKIIKGEKLIQHLHDVMSDLSNKGLKKIFNKLGINEDTFKIENESDMYASMIEQLKKRKDVPTNFIKALEANMSPYGIVGSFEMFQNVFSSLINDNTVKIKTNGGGFIQMSDFGLSKQDAEKQGVIYTPWMDTDKLPTPRFYINPETGKKTVRPGGIFLSGTLLSKYVPNYKDKTSEQLFGIYNSETEKYEGGLIDQEILTNIIGYRIPNQGLPSNDAFEIMGILPDAVGDTVIAYTGITVKTGSDFDIDKMYLMIPSFKVIKTNAYKILTESGLTNKIANKILKAEGITSHDNPINDLYDYLTGLDFFNYNEDNTYLFHRYPELKTLINTVADKIENDPVTRLQYIKPKLNEEGNELDLFEQSEEVIQNKLIEIFKSILTNEKVLPSIMEPLDIPYISNDIKNLFPEEKRNDMMDFDAISDLSLKFEFALGKSGLGQNVNSLVDSVRGALGDLKMLGFSFGKKLTGNDENTEFDKEFSYELSSTDIKEYVESYNKNEPDVKKHLKIQNVEKLKNIKLFDAMMALVNGFVDIAKDPYIVRGNWVTQTNNIGFFMLRAGVHPFYVNAFLGQPIIKKYVAFVNNKESKLIDDSGNLINKFMIEKASENFNEDEAVNINERRFKKRMLFNAFFNINELSLLINTKGKETYSKNKEDFKRNLKSKLEGKFGITRKNKTSTNESEIELLIDELITAYDIIFEVNSNKKFQDISLKELRDNITGTENIETQLAIFTEFEKLSKELAKKLTKSVNSAKVDVNGKGKNITSLIITKNTMEDFLSKEGMIEEISGGITKLINKGKDTFLNTYYKNSILAVYNIMKANSKYFLTASDRTVSTFNMISNFIYGETLQDEVLGNKLEKSYYSYIMSGFKPFKISSEEKTRLLEELPDTLKEKAKENKNSLLLHKLFIKLGEKKKSVISLSNNKISVSEKNDIVDAWKDLLEEDPIFAEDLIKYAYLTSGFNNNINQFHQFIPYEWFNKNRFNSYLKNLDRNTSEFDEAFLKQFFKNNHYDQSIVKKVYKKQLTSFEGDGFRTGFMSDKMESYLVKIENSFFDDFSGRQIKNTRYYRLVGKKSDIGGEVFYYVRNSVLGTKDTKGNRVFEYDLENSNKMTDLKSNEVTDYNPNIYKQIINDVELQSPFNKNMIEKTNLKEETNVIAQRAKISNLKDLKIELDNSETPRVLIKLKGEEIGFIEYSDESGSLVIDSIVVDEQHRRQGYGEEALNQLQKFTGMKVLRTNQESKMGEGLMNKIENKLLNVEKYEGFWTRDEVAKETGKVFLFGDNTSDRLVTKYIPKSTQAVIRGLDNAIGIDTKKDRGTKETSYFKDSDFEEFKYYVDRAIQLAKDSNKTIVIPADGIGTGKAMLKEKAPKLFEYLQEELNKLSKEKVEEEVSNNIDPIEQIYNQHKETLGNITLTDLKIIESKMGTEKTIEYIKKCK